MAKLSPSLIKRISMALRFQYDQITHEPLPDRWVDLIKYLDEKRRGVAQFVTMKGSANLVKVGSSIAPHRPPPCSDCNRRVACYCA